METIERCNPHDLLANRLARPRFYDALCRRTMTQIMQDSSFGHKTLTFDGIDAGLAAGNGAPRSGFL